jgi:hypothetical protein
MVHAAALDRFGSPPDPFAWMPGIGLEHIDPQGPCPTLNGSGQGLGLIGGLGYSVVLQDYQQGQRPFGCYVERLVYNTLGQHTVANKNNRYTNSHGHTFGHGQTGSYRNYSSSCTAGKETVATEMLASSPPGAWSVGFTHYFGHQAFNIIRPGQVMPVPAVVAENIIAGSQRLCDRHRDPFLTETGMHPAGNLSLTAELQQTILRLANGQGLG